LGQAADYTALAIVERVTPQLKEETYLPPQLRALQPAPPAEYQVRHLGRFDLGTRYPAIVAKVGELMAAPQLHGAALVVDATGVGRAVVDMFVEAGLAPVSITITGGAEAVGSGSDFRVPKRDLVAAVQVPLQDQRLKFAEGLPLVETLIAEMLAFRVKITDSAQDTYGSWREGSHDDLILAVMLACWWEQQQERRGWTPAAAAAVIDAFRWTS
jgi:hypothetical protein